MGEDLSFLFWRRQHPNGRLGAHTGESCPHPTAKIFFAQNLNTKFDRRSEKNAVQKTELHFIFGSQALSYNFIPRYRNSFTFLTKLSQQQRRGCASQPLNCQIFPYFLILWLLSNIQNIRIGNYSLHTNHGSKTTQTTKENTQKRLLRPRFNLVNASIGTHPLWYQKRPIG